MKKLILSTVAAALTVTAASAATGDMLTKAQLDNLVKGNKILAINPRIKAVKAKDLDSVYFIQFTAPRGQKLEGFLDKKTGSLYLGGGYDKEGKKISFPVNKKVVDDAVAFTFGNGDKDLYIFTDPQCPFCQQAEKAMKDKLKGYKVHVILFPLQSIHPNAKAMSAYIMAGKTDAEKIDRFHKTLAGSNDYSKANVDPNTINDYLKKSTAAVNELNVRGTPTFFILDKDGQLQKANLGRLLAQ